MIKWEEFVKKGIWKHEQEVLQGALTHDYEKTYRHQSYRSQIAVKGRSGHISLSTTLVQYCEAADA